MIINLPPPQPPPNNGTAQDTEGVEPKREQVKTNSDNLSASDTNDLHNKVSSQMAESINICFDSNRLLRSADTIPFDTDSVLLFLDSCVTDGMTPHKSDFKAGTYNELTTNESYLGSGGSGAILGHGTAQYIITDDTGEQYTMEIPGMAYSPAVPHRLLAPQFIQKIERL